MKALPIGKNTLSIIRNADMVYIDKTDMALKMVERPIAYFLSRPRRFGKSLFVDTLKEIFEGNEPLFRGLHIHDKWDWSRRHPVIKIDFAGGEMRDRFSLDQRITESLSANAERLGVKLDESGGIPGRFGRLIRAAEAAFGQRAVVLVDEYDKPILDNIDDPAAVEMRSGLRNLYSVLKEEDAHLQFVFMTGVSKFSKVSLFSGLNQLEDITIDAAYSTICGYTQADVETHFAEHLEGVDREQLRLRLRPPNFEVRTALNERIINDYTGLTSQRAAIQDHVHDAMAAGDIDGLTGAIIRLFAAIPWRISRTTIWPISRGTTPRYCTPFSRR